MATKQLKKNKIEKGLDTLKTKVANFNKETIQFSDQMVEGSLATGSQWQKVFAKALKSGTVLFGKQQETALETIEILKDQTISGSSRLMKLLEIDRLLKSTNKIKLPEAISNTIETVKTETEEFSAMAEEAKASVKVLVKKARKIATTSSKKMVNTPSVKTAKNTKKAKAVSSKKVATPVKKKATPKTASVKNDLKVIEGIGPKIEGLLIEAGIKTFKQLAATNIKTLKEILAQAGPRFKMHNPTTWRQQAKLAASGKWDQLITAQGKLKGGKISK